MLETNRNKSMNSEISDLDKKYNVVIKELRDLRRRVVILEGSKSEQPELPLKNDEQKRRKAIQAILGISTQYYTHLRQQKLEDAWILFPDPDTIDLNFIAEQILSDEGFKERKAKGEYQKIDKDSILRSLLDEKQKLKKAKI